MLELQSQVSREWWFGATLCYQVQGQQASIRRFESLPSPEHLNGDTGSILLLKNETSIFIKLQGSAPAHTGNRTSTCSWYSSAWLVSKLVWTEPQRESEVKRKMRHQSNAEGHFRTWRTEDLISIFTHKYCLLQGDLPVPIVSCSTSCYDHVTSR